MPNPPKTTNTLDGRTPAVQKPWNDDSTANTNKQLFQPWFQLMRTDFATILTPGYLRAPRLCYVDFEQLLRNEDPVIRGQSSYVPWSKLTWVFLKQSGPALPKISTKKDVHHVEKLPHGLISWRGSGSSLQIPKECFERVICIWRAQGTRPAIEASEATLVWCEEITL